MIHAIDQTGGASLQGVRLTVHLPPPASRSSMHVDGSAGTLDTSPLTAPDGRAEFELPSGTAFQLLAHGNERVGNRTREIPPLTSGERRQITIELPTGNDIVYYGRVLSADDGTPVAGASVRALRGSKWSSQTGDEEGTRDHRRIRWVARKTDPDGLFQLSLSSWTHRDILVEAAGFGPVFLGVGGDHDSAQNAKVVLLDRAATVRAQLLDAKGMVIPDGAVRLWTEAYNLHVPEHASRGLSSLAEAEWLQGANSSGLCLFEDLPPGVPLHVEILRTAEAAKRDLPPLSLEPGEVREVEWTAGSGCRIEGSVVDQAGEPIRSLRIWLQRGTGDGPVFFQAQDGDRVVETSTDLVGRFHFADVSPGEWWVGPAAERHDWDAPDRNGVAPLAQLVEVTEGVPRLEVLLRVHVGLYIRGHVLGPAGEPVAENFVLGSSKDWPGIVTTDTGSDGAFALGPLVPGQYSLVARAWKQADSGPVTANGGDEGIVLRVTAGARLSGTVLDAATGRGCAAELTFVRADQPKKFGGTSHGGRRHVPDRRPRAGNVRSGGSSTR